MLTINIYHIDNIFDDAYPGAFYRRLSSVFDNMGVKLVVRNMAIGNNPCYPYDACIATHLGKDANMKNGFSIA
ncbi:hypothetical protein EON65_19615 [archaeon]|nr:MAG: hypothetical protein EON65_19615 [archaeon]